MQGSDLAVLLLQGLLIGAVPVALVWAVQGRARFARLASLSAFMTFDLVVFGAFTRLTDSGLGCPDWPGCFAKANPFAAAGPIDAAAAAVPGGAVDMTKAWIEMIHRSLAMGVGVLIIALVALAFRHRSSHTLGLALLALVMVLVQGGFGALTVTLRLWPVIVLTHLMLALALLSILVLLAARLNTDRAHLRAFRLESNLLPRLALAALLVLALQIALGGWVSTNYAVLACPDFPLCQGHVLPQMDFADGFSLFHPLGRTARGEAYPIDALTAIHWTHRSMAMVVAVVLLALVAQLRHTPLKHERWWLLGLLVMQLGTGIANVVLGWPLFAAVLHNAGAAALIGVLVLVNYRIRIVPMATSRAMALSASAFS